MKTATKYKFTKVAADEDARDVWRDGKLIGRIHHIWSRDGGWGWNHKVVGKAYRSMTDAAIDMQRRAAR